MDGPVTVDLAFGRGHVPVTMPAGVIPTVIRKAALPKIADPDGGDSRRRWRRPIGATPLPATGAGHARSACILICDITRPVPNRLFLRPMIETWWRRASRWTASRVLVATGLHRPNEGEELAELVGDPWVLANVRVENHFARDDADHVDLGVTPHARHAGEARPAVRRGGPAHRHGPGRAAFHGRLVGRPQGGGAGRRRHHETIRTFHSARFMEDPLAVQCNLVGNPLHEEQLEIVRMLGDVYALNTVIDEDRDLVYVTFGEIIESHLAAVDFVASARPHRRWPRKFKTVVTSSAGYPLDKTYYQTIKGMVTPLDILEPGGTLIIASECSEGFGSPRVPRGAGAPGRTRAASGSWRR